MTLGKATAGRPISDEVARNSLERYQRGPLQVGQTDSYDRHVVFDHAVSLEQASHRERFEAIARSLRDLLTQRWLLTEQTYETANAKRVYYLSLEFLIGRTLIHNIINMGVEQLVREDLRSDPRQDWTEVIDSEPDAGLGNGGLGRLAACFMDSLATLAIPAIGYGLRYDYGIFRQEMKNCKQVEYPDRWLNYPDPWEVARPKEVIKVPIACSFQLQNGTLRAVPDMHSQLLGIPYDRPVVGYGGGNINTLRLWSATSPDFFNFGEFSSGDFVGAIVDRTAAETVTRVLYPDDSTVAGQALRFVQEYFLVCCSLADIVARFRRAKNEWAALLLDEAPLSWDEAWDITVRTLAYTNHTLLPEALEKWPVRLSSWFVPASLKLPTRSISDFSSMSAVSIPEATQR